MDWKCSGSENGLEKYRNPIFFEKMVKRKPVVWD